MARRVLEAELPARGIAYEWWGDVLGGRRSPAPGSRHPAWRDPAFQAYADHMDSLEFRRTLTDLLDGAAGGSDLAVMCAETLWWRCHRRLIADASTVRGTPVVHLLGPGRRQDHPINPALRVGDDGWPIYDVGVDRPVALRVTARTGGPARSGMEGPGWPSSPGRATRPGSDGAGDGRMA